MYEIYFIGRLLEELELADQARDDSERAIHLQVCRYYRDLLTSPQAAKSSIDEPDEA
jgi:hypothetical protein